MKEQQANASAQRNDDAGLHMPIRVYAMLPLDTVNSEGVFKAGSAKWFKQALTLLAASGVHGVAVDIWWGAVERLPGSYSWAGYQQLVQLVKESGLKMQAVLSFHACGGNVGDTAHIGLPPWVLQCGEQDPDLFFTDRPRGGLGQRNKEYISVWSSDERLLCGRTAYECYEDFMKAFKEAFAQDLGSTIEEVVIGAGPCGELRYPSYPERHGWRFPGIGEFQCYDRRSLASLAAAAAGAGHPEWGYGGPHDAGHYNSSPEDTGFFAFSGSWDTAYGRFFLSWYSNCLVRHGERLLQLANRAFAGVRDSTSQAFSTALSERSSRGSADGPQPQGLPSQFSRESAAAAQPQLPSRPIAAQQQQTGLAASPCMVLHPPPQPTTAVQAPGHVSMGARGEQLQGTHAGQAPDGASPQEGSPKTQQPINCVMSSHGSVHSSTNFYDSNTPTSSCTAPLAHDPGLTSSSSSNYLCPDVVGVVRGGALGKGGPASCGRNNAPGWQQQQQQQQQLAGEDIPSTPPTQDLAVVVSEGGPRAVAEGVILLNQQVSQPMPIAPWLGSQQNGITGLPIPGFLTVPPLPLQQAFGNGGLMSPSTQVHHQNSSGGLMSPSFNLHQQGSSGGLLSPTVQQVHSSMHGAPSMTLVASGSSNLPSNAASLCGSEGTLPQASSCGGANAAVALLRPSPRAHNSDVASLTGAAERQQQQLLLLAQLQQRDSASADLPAQRQLPRFMSCQTIESESNGNESAESLAQRQLGSRPNLATLSQPQQSSYRLSMEARNDYQPAAAAGNLGSKPEDSQSGSTPVASPSTPTTSCGEHKAAPLSECSGPGGSPPTAMISTTAAVQPGTTGKAVAGLGDLTHSVGQLSISSASISTQTSLVVDMEDARQQRVSMDISSISAPQSIPRQHLGSAGSPAGVPNGGQVAAPGAGQQQQPQQPLRHPSQPLDRSPVTLSLKIPGVHWWFRSRSHAAELTAGYYNTATRDGYAAVVELCAQHGAALTLTCVEMCDEQHPVAAHCSPEGLLKQIRALTARHAVPLSGENALPIFLNHGVDTVAMERIVINTRAWYGPRAFTPAGRQQAYTYALQQHGQSSHVPTPVPYISTYMLPHQQQLQNQENRSSQHQQSYGMHPSYPPYTAGGWADSASQQGYPNYCLPGPHGNNQAHDSFMGRSFSDAGQLMYYQHGWSSANNNCKPHGCSQPSSQEPTMHGGQAMLHANDMYGQPGAAHGHLRHPDLRSSPQIPDLSCVTSLLMEQGSVGNGTGVGGAARATSLGGASAMPLDLPGEQRGVTACGLRTDSYADIVEPLPAMRSFTFLRLGPELLLAGYQAPWLRFMSGMQQGGYAPCL